MTGDRRPPLVFDDPFVTFDDERAVRALDVLRDLAKDFQVIYLTCSDRYDAVADDDIHAGGRRLHRADHRGRIRTSWCGMQTEHRKRIEHERELIRPPVTVALGATAARSTAAHPPTA